MNALTEGLINKDLQQVEILRKHLVEDPVKRIVLAVDCRDLAQAITLDKSVIEKVGMVKVGNELHNSIGWPKIVDFFNRRHASSYYFDARFSETPNQMEELIDWFSRSTRTVLANEGIISLDVLGASDIALKSAAKNRGDFMLITETVQPSMTEADCLKRHRRTAGEVVLDAAGIALETGLQGFTSSAHEIPEVANEVSLSGLLRVASGIRIDGDNLGDQVRISDPRTAVEMGADLLVVGHSIIEHQDQYERMMRIADEISRAKV